MSRRFHIFVPPGPAVRGTAVYPPVIPRGALQLARAARSEGWDVEVTDGYSFPSQIGTVPVERVCAADVVGVAIHGAPSIAPALELIQAVRDVAPLVPIIVGGNFATVAPELLRRSLPTDVQIVSGGVATTLALLRELGTEESSSGVFAPEGVDTAWESPDLEALDPAFSTYLEDADYQYQLDTQIGCPYRCFHCGTGRPGLLARTITRPLASLRAELEYVLATCERAGFPPPQFWITDETFTADREHAQRVCDIFSEHPGLRWRAQTRADCVELELLQSMRAAGCVSLAFGVEVPSDAGLTLFGKREEMDRVADAFRVTHAAGLRAEAILVFGAPGDTSTFGDIFETLDRLEADSLQSYIYHPVPGSPWWRKYGSSLQLDTAGWSTLDFHSPLVTPCTAEEGDDTIARFVGSLVWSRRLDLMPMIARWRDVVSLGFRCPDCASAVQPVMLHRHGSVEVAALVRADWRLFIAVGQEEVIAYCRRDGHENIHQQKKFLLDDSLDDGLRHLCPNCGILAEAQLTDAERVSV
jgi:radical SAM superfamily enzyme YgiQ (UPF0313 family)